MSATCEKPFPVEKGSVHFSEIFIIYSIVFHSWAITAGHCLTDHAPFNVSMGIRPDGTYDTTVEVPAANQFIYPNYRKSHFIYDIGESPAHLMTDVSPHSVKIK